MGSGDFLGLSCTADCGKRYAALRVAAFLQRPRTAAAQLKALEDAEAWAASNENYSPVGVAAFMLRDPLIRGKQGALFDTASQLQGWSKTAFSKMLDAEG